MIQILNGVRETVDYDSYRGLKLYHNVETEDYPLHWHTALEIIMPYTNTYTIEIDKTPHVLQEGDIFIVPAGILHKLMAPPSGERLILLFDYGLLCNVQGMDTLLHSLHPYAFISVSAYPQLNEKLRHILNEVTDEHENKPPFTEAYIYSLMIQFFTLLGRTSFTEKNRFPGITVHKQHEYVEKFMEVCNYITEHCTENLTLDDLASLSGFSRFHFSRLFKQFTGMSSYDYLTQKRITLAEQLLIQPGISITDAALQSGFGSISAFNRIFKDKKGCTPSEYRKLGQ